MPDQTTSTQSIAIDERASGWSDATVLDFATDAARSIGVGSNTDAGFAPALPPGVEAVVMTSGVPDPDTLPNLQLLAAFEKVLGTSQNAADALRYGGYQGYEGLRDGLAERSTRIDGVDQSRSNFILTNGGAGAIDLIAASFINHGDVIASESPTFSGSLRTLRGHLSKLVGIPMDKDGMDTDALAAILERQRRAGEPVKAIYTIPSYHNPTGTCLTLERRRRLVELSAQYRTLIIEDDAYSEIIFGPGNERLPSLYSLAEGQGVLRAGTFSKTIAPGLRVGWVQGRSDFVEACTRMRFDMGASPLLHRALAEFVQSGQWEAHMDSMRPLYAEKCDALTRTVLTECEPYVRFQRPRGGFFLWVELLNGIDAQKAARFAAEEGALIVPGTGFFTDGGGTSNLRMAFSTARPDELREAARRIGRAIARAAE